MAASSPRGPILFSPSRNSSSLLLSAFDFLHSRKFFSLSIPRVPDYFVERRSCRRAPHFGPFLSDVYRHVALFHRCSWIAVLITEPSFPFSKQLDAPTTLVVTIVSTRSYPTDPNISHLSLPAWSPSPIITKLSQGIEPFDPALDSRNNAIAPVDHSGQHFPLYSLHPRPLFSLQAAAYFGILRCLHKSLRHTSHRLRTIGFLPGKYMFVRLRHLSRRSDSAFERGM